MGNEITREQHDLEASQTRRQIEHQKKRAVLPTLEVLADELEHRAKDGTLAQELHGQKATTLIMNLSRILAAVKEAVPMVIMPGAMPAGPDATWLRAQSTKDMTETEKEQRRKQVLEAEVVKDA